MKRYYYEPVMKIKNSKAENFLPTANKRGVAAVMAVFVLILFSLLGLVICPLFSTRSAGKVNFLASQQALQIAEAGRQYAVWYLTTQDNEWATDWTPEQTLGRGTWRVKVEHDTGIIVTSKGYVPQETNFRAQRVVEMEGTFGIKEGSHPVYDYAIYTDSTDSDSGLALIFDGIKYNLSTDRVTDGDADVHSNDDITFRNWSGKVVEGTVYSAKNVIKEPSWIGIPWEGMKDVDDGIETICPPYLDDDDTSDTSPVRQWYKDHATKVIAGDAIFIDTDIELGDEVNPALIYVEGRVEIGNAKYYRAGSLTKFGIGTIISGEGDITITGPIEPISGNRCSLALVSFFDTVYQYQKNEPPYYEGSRNLTIQNSSSGKEKLFFEIPEEISITYIDNTKNTKNSGSLTVYDFNRNAVHNDTMTKTGSYGYYDDFNTNSLGGADWYYFMVEIKDKNDAVIKEFLGYFITGDPDPQHLIRFYKDSNFSRKTSAFDDQVDVYLQIYGTSLISSIDVSNYSLTIWPRTPIDMGTSGSFRRCKFQLPPLTQDYWYNVKVSTADTTFYKQIYIKPAGATPIYTCSHSNNYFNLEEFADLEIIGNVTARYGLKISPATPLSQINVIYDTLTFRDPKKTNPNALPGAVSFNYTWKEVKD